MTSTQHLDAGAFSLWLHKLRSALVENEGVEVPCNGCTACCRSSLFIHIGPHECNALASIPKELQFPAPGYPKGYVLLGFGRDGRCPMFIENECSIYEHRPMTCRQFDCRVLAAAGLADGSDNTPIAQQARRWQFTFPARDDRNRHAAVRDAAQFLRDHTDLFPKEFVPRNMTQLSVLSVKVYEVFHGLNRRQARTDDELTDAEIAKAVMEAFDQFEKRRNRTIDTLRHPSVLSS